MTDFCLKAFELQLAGFEGPVKLFAPTRSSARYLGWMLVRGAGYTMTFIEFLRRSRCVTSTGPEGFGSRIVVCGQPAFLVEWIHDSGYCRFVRPGSKVILRAHPSEIEEPSD